MGMPRGARTPMLRPDMTPSKFTPLGTPPADTPSSPTTSSGTPQGPRLFLSRLFAGLLQVGLAAGLGSAVAWGLPARWPSMDGWLITLTGLGVLGGLGLVWGHPMGRRLSAVASVAWLVSGLLLVTLLSFSSSYLAGLYGPVGQGGAALFAVAALLVLAYLVIFPVVILFASRTQAHATPGKA